MGKINWGRLFLGGLLACVVMNLIGAVLGSLLFTKGELTRLWTTVRPLERWPTPTLVLLISIIVSYLVGTLVVWWYAAIRPRFGPGPKTAALAGFAFWLSASPIQILLGGYILEWPLRVLITVDAMHLIQSVAATVAGAWAYRE